MSRDSLEHHFIAQLLDMGYTEPQAQTAVRRTHSVGVEAAVNWIVDHPDYCEASTSYAAANSAPAIGFANTVPGEPVMGVPSLAPLVIHPDGQPAQAVAVGGTSTVKSVLVVSLEPHMAPGKLAAQSAHAALGLYQVMLANQVPWMAAWLGAEEPTAVVTVETEQELQELAHHAEQLPIASYLLRDAGASEAATCSHTVLALAGWANLVNGIIEGLPEL